MKLSFSILSGFFLLSFFALVFPAEHALAQDNPDEKPHIQPRATPTPTPALQPNEPSPKSQDQQYERPPFPGDQKYERPPFPGDVPQTGEGATGESSSRDSQIDLNARPLVDAPKAAEDESVLKPWDPHKAAKDVEVGQYYLKVKNYRAALERFNHALVYKSDDAEATYGLAVTQEKLNLLDQANQSYRRYLQILPNGPKAKESEEAIQRIAPHLGTGIDPANGGYAKQAAHDIDVGETYLSANNFDAARERFEEALRLSPENALVYFRLAQSLQGMQRLDPARLYYRKYLELQPKGKFARDAKKAIGDIDYILGK